MSLKTEIQNIDTFLSSISKGSHGCLFYSHKEQKLKVLFNFLRDGLEKDQFCVYASAREDASSIEDMMRRIEPSYQKFSDSLSIVQGNDLYRSPENPDLESWISSFDSLLKDTERKGKKSLRIAADLSSYFIEQGLTEQWFELETSIERKFPGRITVLCAYDANLVSSKVVTNILDFYKQVWDSRSRRFVEVHSFAIFPFGAGKTIILTIE